MQDKERLAYLVIVMMISLSVLVLVVDDQNSDRKYIERVVDERIDQIIMDSMVISGCLSHRLPDTSGLVFKPPILYHGGKDTTSNIFNLE